MEQAFLKFPRASRRDEKRERTKSSADFLKKKKKIRKLNFGKSWLRWFKICRSVGREYFMMTRNFFFFSFFRFEYVRIYIFWSCSKGYDVWWGNICSFMIRIYTLEYLYSLSFFFNKRKKKEKKRKKKGRWQSTTPILGPRPSPEVKPRRSLYPSRKTSTRHREPAMWLLWWWRSDAFLQPNMSPRPNDGTESPSPAVRLIPPITIGTSGWRKWKLTLRAV